MQQIRYFSSAWNDINHSPGWFGKMCLLGLISCIPIFGLIVVRGYLYGWAREMAWGVHEPLPARIFGNEDGKLYRRGGYLFLFGLVLGLIVYAILFVVGMIPGMSAVSTVSSYEGVSVSVANYSVLYYLVYIVVAIIQMFALWIGSMRISIYDRLSAGFQFGKLWSMFKHEPSGIWRILGMQILVGFVIGFVVTIVFSILLGIVLVGALGAATSALSAGNSVEMIVQLLLTAGPGFIVVFTLMVYVLVVVSVFLEALAARALGYWTMQFDVPRWRSQDDPMPFEDTFA